MHRFNKDHVKTLAGAIAGAVMPRSERSKLTDVVVDLLADTAPKPTAKRPDPAGQFTGRVQRAFTDEACPDSGTEIVATVAMGSDGSVIYESWSVEVSHPKWGVTSREAGSFAEALALAWKEEFCRNPGAVPVRIDTM